MIVQIISFAVILLGFVIAILGLFFLSSYWFLFKHDNEFLDSAMTAREFVWLSLFVVFLGCFLTAIGEMIG